MSDTPRTDREVYKISERDFGFEAVGATLCRMMERELAEKVSALSETVTRADLPSYSAELLAANYPTRTDASILSGPYTPTYIAAKRIEVAEAERDQLASMDDAAMDKMQTMIREQSERIVAVASYAVAQREALTLAAYALIDADDTLRDQKLASAADRLSPALDAVHTALAKNPMPQPGSDAAMVSGNADAKGFDSPAGPICHETWRDCDCPKMFASCSDEKCPRTDPLRHQSGKKPTRAQDVIRFCDFIAESFDVMAEDSGTNAPNARNAFERAARFVRSVEINLPDECVHQVGNDADDAARYRYLRDESLLDGHVEDYEIKNELDESESGSKEYRHRCDRAIDALRHVACNKQQEADRG